MKTTDDGYIIIPSQKEPAETAKGFQCGQCGMKFDYGVAYGYCCPHSNCPVQPKATF